MTGHSCGAVQPINFFQALQIQCRFFFLLDICSTNDSDLLVDKVLYHF